MIVGSPFKPKLWQKIKGAESSLKFLLFMRERWISPPRVTSFQVNLAKECNLYGTSGLSVSEAALNLSHKR